MLLCSVTLPQAEAVEWREAYRREEGDTVVVFGRWAGRAKGTGKTYESEWVMAWTFRDGKVSQSEFTGPAPTRLYRADLSPVLGILTGPSPVFVTIEAAADGQQVSVFPATPLER